MLVIELRIFIIWLLLVRGMKTTLDYRLLIASYSHQLNKPLITLLHQLHKGLQRDIFVLNNYFNYLWIVIFLYFVFRLIHVTNF